MKAAVLLILVGLALRWAALSSGFVYEDRVSLLAPWLVGPRMLTYVSWRLVQTPGAAHALNLALHLVNTALFAWLVARLALAPFAQIAAVTLFWLHPLTVEAVAYATGRADLFALMGILIAMIAATGASVSWVGLAAGVALGLAGKESAIVGFGLVPLVMRNSRRRIVLLSGALVCGLGLWHMGGWGALQVRTAEFADLSAHLPAADWFRLQATATIRLMALALNPWMGQTVDYDYDRLSLTVQTVCAVSLLPLVVAAWLYRHTLIGLGLGWVLIASLPRWFVQTPRSYYNEHQFYTALPGMVLVVAGLLSLIPAARTEELCH